jgi:ankyrin repeat protein
MQKKDTPLSVAAEHGKVKVVRVLISLGADVNKTLKDMVSVLLVGWSCLLHSFNFGDSIVLTNITSIALQGKTTPLISAAKKNRHEVVAVLIQEGAVAINHVDKMVRWPSSLCTAIFCGATIAEHRL